MRVLLLKLMLTLKSQELHTMAKKWSYAITQTMSMFLPLDMIKIETLKVQFLFMLL